VALQRISTIPVSMNCSLFCYNQNASVSLFAAEPSKTQDNVYKSNRTARINEQQKCKNVNIPRHWSPLHRAPQPAHPSSQAYNASYSPSTSASTYVPRPPCQSDPTAAQTTVVESRRSGLSSPSPSLPAICELHGLLRPGTTSILGIYGYILWLWGESSLLSS
jgi:hypothetical protein